jgi:hypothetical protein
MSDPESRWDDLRRLGEADPKLLELTVRARGSNSLRVRQRILTSAHIVGSRAAGVAQASAPAPIGAHGDGQFPPASVPPPNGTATSVVTLSR